MPFEASVKGTSSWFPIDKQTFDVYQKKPFSQKYKTRETSKTEPLPEVEVKPKTTKKK